MAQRGNALESERTSRRSFLRASSTAIGAAALNTLGSQPAVHAAGSDQIKVGLIGCGQRGTGAAIQAMEADPGVRVIAVADVFEDHVQKTIERLKAASPPQAIIQKDHGFVGFDAYRKVIESDVDVVLIACASRFHPSYLSACVDAGKHVFVEKPHAVDPPGVHVVAAACENAREKDLFVVSGLHRRYDRSVQETIQRVQDGAIGDIVSMEVSFMRAPYRVIPRDPKWSEMEWQFRTWYHFRWLSGDDVVQSLIHTTDVATWAMGEQPPQSAHALAGRSASIEHRYGDVFDHTAVVNEYAGGARLYGLVRTQVNCHNEVAVKLFGTRGTAVEGRIWGEHNWSYGKRPIGGHAQEQIDFFAALRAGDTINNGSYMTRSTMVVLMGQLAAYTGKKITWDEINKSEFKYPPADDIIDFTTVPPVLAAEDGIYPTAIPGRTQLG